MRQWLEHEAKAAARRAGLCVPDGEVAADPQRAAAIATKLGGEVVVKAQVPTGGRGKAGGIVRCPAPDAGHVAERLLRASVRGFDVPSVLVEEAIEDAEEFYLGFTIDPESKGFVLLVSAAGGVEVERDAARHLGRVNVSDATGLMAWHVYEVARQAGIPKTSVPRLHEAAAAVYRLFLDTRAVLVEVNPLLLGAGEGHVAADVRVIPDPMLDLEIGNSASTPRAAALGFDLVILDPDGDVALITTGAGGTMLLIDLLGDAGVRPTNFCDIRTGNPRARQERFEAALRDLGELPKVQCLAINIFAGVTSLIDMVPDLLAALQAVPVGIPVVARVEGRDVGAARAALSAHGIIVVDGIEALVAEIRSQTAPGRSPEESSRTMGKVAI